MTDARLPQPVAEVLLVERHAGLDGRRHIDLEQHVDAAAQVETEAHRMHPELAHPVRQFRRQGQRDIGLARVLAAQAIAGLRLVFTGIEAQHGPAVLQVSGFRRDAGALDHAHELGESGFVVVRAVAVGNLHRIDATVNIRQCKKAARQQYGEHKRV